VKGSDERREQVVTENHEPPGAEPRLQGAQPQPAPEHVPRLRLSEEHLELALEAARVGAWQWDVQTGAVRWSEGVARLFGLSTNDFDGTYESYLELIHHEDRPQVAATIEKALSDDTPYVVEHRVELEDGGMRWLTGRGTVIRDSGGNPVRMTGVVADITERKEAEQRLRESEERFRVFSQSSFEAIAFGHRGRVVDANDACLAMLGYTYEELIGEDVTRFVAPEDLELVASKMRSGFDRPYEHRALRKDGSIVYVEACGRSVTYRGLECRMTALRDITERRRMEAEQERLEAQLRRAQRIEAVGELAGGIAHDFNNILTAILGNVELALDRVRDRTDPPSIQLLDELQEIELSAKRAADLTGQLLAFSRRQMSQPKVLDLNAVLLDLERMLRRLIREEIELRVDVAADLKHVRADPGQWQQVIVNLVVNARDAMPDGGTITVATANVLAPPSSVGKRSADDVSAHVALTVADTGVGMDEDTLEHVFEPFFTTKAPGRGTGLGMAVVYGIVRQSGGQIRVHSTPSVGTRVEILLPASEPTDSHVAERRPESPSRAGTEVVLVCEDDSTVRRLAVSVLERAGYQVLAAEGGRDALQVAAASPRPIELLVTDVVMPDMNGKAVARTLRASHPRLKTLYCSGYAEDVISHHGILETGVEFLQKPFSRRALLDRVRQVLDADARE
jgi:two-component system cell cycle sensor histidine kinase/response regulator CckA